MDFSTLKALSIPEGNVTKIEVEGIVTWELPATYTNQVPISVASDGSIFNGCGYKNGYRLSSGGGESSATYGTVTGFIKAKPGDTIRIKGYQWYNTSQSINYLVAYSSAFSKAYTGNAQGTYDSAALIESMEYDATTGISTVVLKSGISFEYIRISVYYWDVPDGANLIVTVNEEIT